MEISNWDVAKENSPLVQLNFKYVSPHRELLPMVQQPLVDQGLLIIKASRSHYTHLDTHVQ